MTLSEVFGPYGRNFRQLFYLVTPSETTYTSLEEVPPFLDLAIPWLLLLIALDLVACWKKGMKDAYSFHDSLTSLASGFIQTMVNKTAEIYLYSYVFDHWAIYPLPADSAWTWLITFVVVDLFYYWMHRGAHEINIFWAFHQVHHSSEYFNMSTALRQGAFQQYVAMLFYLPQALFIPPPMHLAHEILNRLNQSWIHSPVIGDLGPLEHILNTPSHHRVHHGRNRYCIDKNYAGTFIIWDKMFGTFQPELESKTVIYGLTHNVNTYDAMDIQLRHFKHVLFEKLPSANGFVNKLKALFYGPGWSEGKPRLGDLNDIPEPEHPVRKYNPCVPTWIALYIFVQGLVFLITYQELANRLKTTPYITGIAVASAFIISVYNLSCLQEKRWWAPYAEIGRCAMSYIWLLPLVWPSGLALTIMRTITAASAVLWICKIIVTLKTVSEKLHKD